MEKQIDENLTVINSKTEIKKIVFEDNNEVNEESNESNDNECCNEHDIDKLTNLEGFNICNLTKQQLNSFSPEQLYSLLHGVPWFKQLIVKLKLSAENKRKYNSYKKHIKNIKNNPKNDFDKSNIFEINDFRLWYANKTKQALFGIEMNIPKNLVTAFIGPSGCGKSTLLRSLNRMNDIYPNIVTEGNIWFDGENIASKNLSALELRTKVGMVFQKAVPFEMSIYDNVAYGPRSHGIKEKEVLDKLVKDALIDAALWDEVKDDLDKPGSGLSGGQQQRLCIARAIVMKPTVLLMDEPTSALDPIATAKVEELILKLKNSYTIILVTHSMTQAQRVSDLTAFFYKGNLIEYNTTKNIFTNPQEKMTKDYISGKF